MAHTNSSRSKRRKIRKTLRRRSRIVQRGGQFAYGQVIAAIDPTTGLRSLALFHHSSSGGASGPVLHCVFLPSLELKAVSSVHTSPLTGAEKASLQTLNSGGVAFETLREQAYRKYFPDKIFDRGELLLYNTSFRGQTAGLFHSAGLGPFMVNIVDLRSGAILPMNISEVTQSTPEQRETLKAAMASEGISYNRRLEEIKVMHYANLVAPAPVTGLAAIGLSSGFGGPVSATGFGGPTSKPTVALSSGFGGPASGFGETHFNDTEGEPNRSTVETRYRTFMQGTGGGRPIDTSPGSRGRVTTINGKPVINYIISSHGGYPASGSPSFRVNSDAEIVFYSDHGAIIVCPNIVQTQICWQGKEDAVYERYEPTRKCPDYTLTSDYPRLAWKSGVIDCNVSNSMYGSGSKAAPIINLDDRRRGRQSQLSDIVDEIMIYHKRTYGRGYIARIHCSFCRYVDGTRERTTELKSEAWREN